MNRGERPDLNRARDIGVLLSDSFVILIRHFGVYVGVMALALLVIVAAAIPAGVVAAAGASDLTIAIVAAALLIPASILSQCISTGGTLEVLRADAAGEDPAVMPAIRAAWARIGDLFVTGVLLVLGVFVGFLLLILPGFYLLVAWYFAWQAVWFHGLRGSAALAASRDAVSGSWWRVFGIGIAFVLLSGIVGSIITLPLSAAASATDNVVWDIAQRVISNFILTPYLAVGATLLYFDLLARKGGATVVGSPEWGAQHDQSVEPELPLPGAPAPAPGAPAPSGPGFSPPAPGGAGGSFGGGFAPPVPPSSPPADLPPPTPPRPADGGRGGDDPFGRRGDDPDPFGRG